jgi:hypothetical protein
MSEEIVSGLSNVSLEEKGVSLFQIVKRGFQIYGKLENFTSVPGEVEEGIKILTEADVTAKGLGIYLNDKESLDLTELAPNEIRLLCIPFLLGYFYGQLPYDENTRIVSLQKSRVKILTFLKICDEYSIFNVIPALKKIYESFSSEKKVSLVADRTALVERMKQERAVNAKIKDILKRNQKKGGDEETGAEDLSFSDEQELRELYLLQVQVTVDFEHILILFYFIFFVFELNNAVIYV